LLPLRWWFDLELLLEVVGFLAVAPGHLALTLGTLGRFLRGLLVLLRLAAVQLGLLTVAAGLFPQALAFHFAAGTPLARCHHGNDEEDGDYYDYGDDQSG
jgi:hypothetical protein